MSNVCRNPTCIAENVNAEGWCPIHAKYEKLRGVSAIKEATCRYWYCGEQLDKYDGSDDYCSRQCRENDREMMGDGEIED